MLRFFGGQASRPILPCFAAEGVGLEPTRANRPAGFRNQFLSHSEHPSIGVPGVIRTRGLQFRKLSLYPAELREQKKQPPTD